MTKIEEEVVLLRAVKELIDSMVNFEVLDVLGSDPNCNILFKTMTHQRFFNIVLVDFLSRTDKRASVSQTSYLGALKSICSDPSFDVHNSVMLLAESTRAFADWLEQEVEVATWFPSIDTETTLKITRISFLKMCGDISKHNFLRSVGVAERRRGTQRHSCADGCCRQFGRRAVGPGRFFRQVSQGHTELPRQHDCGVPQQHSVGHLPISSARIPQKHRLGKSRAPIL
jgi:hypothetical protein